ncbi:signal recognition particle-docking protein FtsY [Buchnera aphidicola]|uniref:signal recognition particle-docking protein FtsY n=1 Tax=Buchnera aphidicola TaxID=9 RepID=UPI0034640AC1
MSGEKNSNLFSWFKKIKDKTVDIKDQLFYGDSKNIEHTSQNISKKKNNFFQNIYLGIKKNKDSFACKIKNFFMYHEINDNFFKQLEENLLMYDFGYEITKKVIAMLITEHKKNKLKKKKELYLILKQLLCNTLKVESLNIYNSYNKLKNIPHIILMAGVNGVGKTTTIAKLAYLYKKIGYSVMLSASDTFRAAAIDQLKIWGEKINIPVFSCDLGTDPSAVIFDSIQYAKNNNIDIVLIDTSGRLHNKVHLMQELKKNIRVIRNNCLHSPQEIFLVLDACNGQNSMNQVEIFYQEIKKITGIILTKLDGTAKGGIVFSIVNKFHIPIKYIGIGEKLQDIYLFNKKEFVDTFFSEYNN